MAAIGLPETFWSSLRPVVTHSGKSYVNVGMVPADAAEQIAEAIRTTRNGTP
ncbi:L-seryl-tRNA selenium transferase [Streptomyces sp. NPDC003691]